METLDKWSMKLYSLVLFLLISYSANSQRNIDSLLLVRNALISKVYNGTNTPEEKKELVQIGFTIQNAGFVLEENMGDYEGAMAYIDQALPVWTALRDYNLQANLLKYKGLLLGYMGNFSEAKSLIHHAIRLYDREEETACMAVSQLNLARVYDHQSKVDSAIYFANIALTFWEQQEDAERVFQIHSFLIHLFLKKGLTDNAVALHAKNEEIKSGNELFWMSKMEYYYISKKLFETTGDQRKAEAYHKEIMSLEKELEHLGIHWKNRFAN